MKWLWSMVLIVALAAGAMAQEKEEIQSGSKGKLLVVATAHLDTQWRWTIKTTIDEYIKNTFEDNFRLFEQYPDYVFSFEGAFRYQLIKEYYPEAYERLKQYIADGRWRVTGSWVDAVDVNIPSFESLVRHTLYGNGYFEQEFGKTSRDIYLPDCFGFGYALPSIAHHCGLQSFSTQKLTWGSWVGIPFDIGIWEGVDGSTLICGVNPGAYASEIRDDLSRDTIWAARVMQHADSLNLPLAYKYFGTGDVGGSPDSQSVGWLEKSMHSDGPVQVLSVGADDLIDYVEQAKDARLPHYKGELVMTRHGVGCYSSEATMKRWNRRNELLADAAERVSVLADYHNLSDYPRDMLRDTWTRFLWHQFHDDLTGTSIPEAYEYSWNDEALCMNRFAAVERNGVQAMAAEMNTVVKGVPLVVYNPLAVAREDLVEATVRIKKPADQFIRVYDYKGKEVPADLLDDYGDSVRILFPALIPSVGLAVYDVRTDKKASQLKGDLSVSLSSLENERYRVQVDALGEITSIHDKLADCEMLSEPFRFELYEDSPKRWPSWEIDYDDLMADPLDEWVGPAEIHVVEDGNVRVALEIVKHTAHSTVTATLSLASGGAADRIELNCGIDWYERGRLLEAVLSSAAPDDSVTYDLGLGTITRGLNIPELYEVPGQQWADLSNASHDYGVAILNDCRYGWDHPQPDKLRLTLLHTPQIGDNWQWVEDERSQDNGHHQVKLALYGHAGDWRQGHVVWQAARVNQPLVAYQTTPHKGNIGNQYSFLSVQTGDDVYPGVMVNAVKMAEESDQIVVRVRELNGMAANDVTIRFADKINGAEEVNGQEKTIGAARTDDGTLTFSLTPYQPKAFAVDLSNDFHTKECKPTYKPLKLAYNVDGISTDALRTDGDFDGNGNTLPGELIPDIFRYLAIPFVSGPKEPGQFNVLKCEGQNIDLPSTNNGRLFIVAASVGGPTVATFAVGDNSHRVALTDYESPVGRWNSRMMGDQFRDDSASIAPAYINQQPVAFYVSHLHNAAGENDAYRFGHFYLVELPIPPNSRSVMLPNDPQIRILAATVSDCSYPDVRPAAPLYDRANNTLVQIVADSNSFAGTSKITLESPIPGVTIYYTLDGSEPSEATALFERPFSLDETTTIRARATLPGANDNYVASLTVEKLALWDAVEPSGETKDLHARYFEGEWSKLPDFDTIQPAREFSADSVYIPDFARDEDYGFAYDGYVQIPYDGVYAFAITSDDGSRLWVDDSLLADNDGLHGDYEMTGTVGLKAGYHKFRAVMFQSKGGEALSVTIAGPSLPKQTLDISALHEAGSH